MNKGIHHSAATFLMCFKVSRYMVQLVADPDIGYGENTEHETSMAAFSDDLFVTYFTGLGIHGRLAAFKWPSHFIYFTGLGRNGPLPLPPLPPTRSSTRYWDTV